MKIAIPKERRPREARVAASPDTVKKFVGLGFDVVVEKGAGEGAAMTDDAFTEAGASIADTEEAALNDADIVLKVRRPLTEAEGGPDEIKLMKPGSMLIGLLEPWHNADQIEAYAKHNVTAFAMELLPRISRAQSMDVLSSQSNLVGYKAVCDAASEFGRAFPMMMTAAGTVPPAKVIVLGAGVAGLQAVATAKRLGAVVSAYDVRPAVKEQIESLGGKFVAVDEEAIKEAETAGGYAKEMAADYKQKGAAKLLEVVPKNDIVVCTALIPGKPSPVLVTEDIVKAMRPGSVIVDISVEQGGNCTLTEPGKMVTKHGVKILGHLAMQSRIAIDASALYAKNLLNFLTPHVDKESKALKLDWDDEVIKGSLLTRDGAVVNPALTGEGQ